LPQEVFPRLQEYRLQCPRLKQSEPCVLFRLRKQA